MKNTILTHVIFPIIYGVYLVFSLSYSSQVSAESLRSYDTYEIHDGYPLVGVDAYGGERASDIAILKKGEEAAAPSTRVLRFGNKSEQITLRAYAEFDLYSRSPRERTFITFKVQGIEGPFGENISSVKGRIDLFFNNPLGISRQYIGHVLTATTPREFNAHHGIEPLTSLYVNALQAGDVVSIDITDKMNAAIAAKWFDAAISFSWVGSYGLTSITSISLTDNDLTTLQAR